MINARLACAIAIILCVPYALVGQDSPAPIVRFHTTLGDMDVTLLPNAPLTVANFLNYMNRGAYNNSVIHRSVPGFIIQGGGFQLQNHTLVAIPADAPVINEPGVSNARGTLAMAKLGSDPNSATSQWFFNEGDNSANLNAQNGGFTVFGRIVDSAGLAIMDKIASVPVPTPGPLPSPFDQIPLLNYTSGSVQDQNYVVVLSVTSLVPFPSIASNGVIGASNFGGYPAAGPGSWIEIYGSNLAGTTRGWAGSDFSNGKAPTSLDGVSVTIAGQPAYVSYVSPSQINVQVPAGVPASGLAPVVVTYNNESSVPVTLSLRPYEGGLLAPSTFNVAGKQYVAAIHASTGFYVTNGNVPGLPAAPAVPGETLIFYGVGFGPVTPGSIPVAGQIVQGQNNLATALQFNIGQIPAQVAFAGLVQGLVGVYQFNVVVPANAPNGDLPVDVSLGALTVPQTLFLPVRAAVQ